MEKKRRILMRGLAGLLGLVLLMAGTGIGWFQLYLPWVTARQSFPAETGVIHLTGLEQPVEVRRDALGVAHIYAASVDDLFFAQGYVHAQDRFWQMDVWRHVGAGRLAEMFGDSQFGTDVFLRSMGWYRVAEREWAQLAPASRALLHAYAAGVNAWLAGHQGARASLEYALLDWLSPDYQIEPWEPVHTLTWGKAMAWDLRGNLEQELERAQLLQTLSLAQVQVLYPDYPADHPLTVPSASPVSVSVADTTSGIPAGTVPGPVLPPTLLTAVQENTRQLDTWLGPGGSAIGSNAWVVSGRLTRSGLPLLANDPHLGVELPSIWYRNSLHCRPQTPACRWDVNGFSFAGVPGVVIGHNRDIAWGLTNLGADVMDLFLERVSADDAMQYAVPGGWEPFVTRTETIRIAGAPDRQVQVRSTRHGPVISDFYAAPPARSTAGATATAETTVAALAWTALEPASPFEAMWQLNLARNWAEFRAAAAHFQAPAQNLLYADAKGHIGYQAPGHIPLRNSGDGWLPVAGWDGVHDWQGTVPFADLPRVLDPAEGFLVSANNRVAAGAYPFLTRDWDTGFRARRIVALLQGQRQLTRADMVRMQADAHNAMAALLVPRLLALKPAFTTLREREALALLRGWDYQDRADSAGAALFATFWAQLLLNTFADQVPTGIDGGNRWYEVVRRLLPEPDSDWWDNVDTPEREGGDDQLVHAFRTALAALTARLGDDPSAWRWERLHTVTFRHGTLGRSGIGPVERLFNLKPVGVGGNGAAINATGWHIGNPAVNWLPSLRMVVTPGDWEQSVAILTTGQSGHAFHPHYADMLPLWAAHRQARMAPPVTKGAVLRLLPDTDSIARKAQ